MSKMIDKPDTVCVDSVNSEAAAPQYTNDERYQLYKLLAYAIQELDWFTKPQNISDTLSLPHPDRVIINRASLAVEKLMYQDVHFFSGYAGYRNVLPQAIETTEPAQADKGVVVKEDTTNESDR